MPKTRHYAIDSNYKVVYASKNTISPEALHPDIFAFSTFSDLNKEVVKEISKANSLNAKTPKELFKSLKLKFKKGINKMSKNQGSLNKKQTAEIVKMVKDEVEETQVLITMVQYGVPFNKAQRKLNEMLEEAGVRVSIKTIEEVFKEEAEVKEIETFAEVQSYIDFMKERCEGATEKQIMTVIRRAYRDKGFDLPKMKKVRVSVEGKMENWLIENPEASDKDIMKFATKTMEKSESVGKRLIKKVTFARRFAEAVNSAEETEG